MSIINSETARYCYIDLDLCQHRAKLATAAAFVDATDSRYGFSTKDILSLGGSELARIPDLIQTDHEWSSKINAFCGGSSIEIRPPDAGNRIVVRLNWEASPLACENFAALCHNGSIPIGKTKPQGAVPIGTSGKPLTYRGSVVHRIQPNFVAQGGDFVFGNGTGGESIYNGKKFKDERAGLLLKHDRRGILSMGNSGKNSNSTDGESLVLDAIETLGSANGEPIHGAENTCRVTDCGLYVPLLVPGAGYWIDTPDADSYTGVSPVFVVRPRVAIVAPSDAVAERFRKALRPFCSVARHLTLDVADHVETVVAELRRLLEEFAIDVILLAPSCTSAILASLQLPTIWKQASDATNLADVVLEAKPVEALDVVHTKSWLSRQSNWKLDCP